MKRLFFILVFTILLSGCAKRSAPPGGPKDEISPKVLETVPADGELNIAIDSQIKLQFSEPVKSDARTVLLYPSLDDINVRFKKNTVEINHSQPFAENTTYSIILTPDFSDRHGNSIGKTTEIAFSTGPELDTLEISGTVIDVERFKPTSNALVAIYSDSLMSESPLRITYSSEKGNFSIKHLPARQMWLYAGTGVDTDIAPDSAEKIAIPSGGTALPHKKPIILAIVTNDTLPPTIVSTDAPDSYTVCLKFNEKVIFDTEGTDFSNAISWIDPDDSLHIMILFSEPCVGKEYSFMVCDRRYNCADLTAKIPIEAPLDTIAPSIEKKKGGMIISGIEPIHITANEPFSADINLLVIDSLKGFDIMKITPNRIQLILKEIPPPESQIRINFEHLCDEHGNCTQDSIIYTVNKSKPGEFEVSGLWECEQPVVFIRDIAGNIFRLSMSESSFSCDVPGGRYTLWRFCDRNADDVWTPGCIDEFRYSEPIEYYPDTLYVRPGWKTEINW